jgi:hypothetical protein
MLPPLKQSNHHQGQPTGAVPEHRRAEQPRPPPDLARNQLVPHFPPPPRPARKGEAATMGQNKRELALYLENAGREAAVARPRRLGRAPPPTATNCPGSGHEIPEPYSIYQQTAGTTPTTTPGASPPPPPAGNAAGGARDQPGRSGFSLLLDLVGINPLL